MGILESFTVILSGRLYTYWKGAQNHRLVPVVLSSSISIRGVYYVSMAKLKSEKLNSYS